MLHRQPVRSVATMAFAATLLFGSGCGEPEPVQELPPRAIRWMKVTGDLPAEERVISGIVTAVDETSLAFEVGGTVLDVVVHLGEEVKRDDVLARLDPEPFELAVRNAEADLADIIARRQAAEANYSRTVALFEADVASRQDLDRDTAAGRDRRR